MTQDAALLEAILAQPDEDGVRLVYADWLEEHGNPERAEFIRVQIALAGMDQGDPDGEALRLRQGVLRSRHGEAWQAELPELPDGLFWGDFRRGFIDGVRAVQGGARVLLSGAERIPAAIPLRRLTLVCWPATEVLAGSALLGRARELVLHRNSFTWPARPVDDPLLVEVMCWPELRQLTHLGLHQPEISSAGVTALARADLAALAGLTWARSSGSTTCDLEPLLEARWLRRLVSLELANHPSTGPWLLRLCASLPPGQLRRLTLRHAHLNDADAIVLANSGLLAGLQVLDLEHNGLGPAGTQALIGALPTTARLLLGHNPIGAKGLQALAASPLLARLGGLRCGRSDCGDEGVSAVAGSPYAGRLSLLLLANQQVGNVGVEALLNSTRLTALRMLNLDGNCIDRLPACRHETLEGLSVADNVVSLEGNRLGAAGLKEFAARAHLPALRHLNLEANRLAGAAVQGLADAAGLGALRHLNLSSNPLGDAGAAALAGGRGLPALEELCLQECGIGDAGVRAWMDSPRLCRLKNMKLSSRGNHISKAVYHAFCKRALQQGCNVDHYASRTIYHALRRAPGMRTLLAKEDRTALTVWINALHYAEYRDVGWLKAVDCRRLRQWVSNSKDVELLERYLKGENSAAELQRHLIRLFLGNWLVGNVPESIGTWGLDAGEFHPVSRAEAMALVDRIVSTSMSTSMQDQEADIRGRLPPYVIGEDPPTEVEDPADGAEETVIPYAQLRVWFAAELFDNANAVFFAHTTAGGPAVRADAAQPRVLGLDGNLIGMLWLE